MSRYKPYTKDKLLDVIMKIIIPPNQDLYRTSGKINRLTYREMCEHRLVLNLTKWSKKSKNHLGSFREALKSFDIDEMFLYEKCKELGLIPLSTQFEDFTQNKRREYNRDNIKDINKPIPQTNMLIELCARFGIPQSTYDVSLLPEEVIFEAIRSMGFSQKEIEQEYEEIKQMAKGRASNGNIRKKD